MASGNRLVMVEPIDDDVLQTIARMAALSRAPGSAGEGEAAAILARSLRRDGVTVSIERERVHGTYWVPIGIACAAAAAGPLGGRPVAALAGALSAASTADDLELGRRPLRRLLRQRMIANVIGELAPAEWTHTIVVHAHHDAARTGLVFHPAGAKLAARLGGRLIERAGGTPAPMWGAVGGPACVLAGALAGSRRLRRAGALVSAGYAAAMADIARHPPVPGANDNLSGVAVLLALARRLAQRPPAGLRVLLLSTGSEESFLEGMVAFGDRHFRELPPGGTTFLCLESVGSPELMVLDGEGLLRRQRYPRELIAALTRLADRERIPLHPPFRYRLATDGQVPLRAGYPTAAISSIDWYKAPSNYHWPSDTPEHLHLQTIARAAALAEAFIRDLAPAARRA